MKSKFKRLKNKKNLQIKKLNVEENINLNLCHNYFISNAQQGYALVRVVRNENDKIKDLQFLEINGALCDYLNTNELILKKNFLSKILHNFTISEFEKLEEILDKKTFSEYRNEILLNNHYVEVKIFLLNRNLFVAVISNDIKNENIDADYFKKNVIKLFEILPYGILITAGKTLTYNNCNLAFENIIEKSRKNIIGKRANNLFPEPFAKELEDFDEIAIKNNEIYQLKKTILLGDNLKNLEIIKIPLLLNNNDWLVINIVLDKTEEYQKQQIAIKQKEQLKEVSILARLGYWEYDNKTTNIKVSNEARNIYKTIYQQDFPEDLSFSKFLKYVHHDDQERVENEFYASIKNREIFDCLFRIKLNNKVTYLHSRCCHKFDENIHLISSIGLIIDVTENIENLQEIQKTSKLLKDSHALLNSGYWIYDIIADSLDASIEVLKLFELIDHNTLNKDNVVKYFTLEQFEDLKEKLTVAYQKNKSFNLTYSLVIKKSLKTLNFKGYFLYNSTGEITKIFGIVQDISSFSLVEKTSSWEEIDFLENKLNFGIWKYDKNLNSFYFSNKSLQILEQNDNLCNTSWDKFCDLFEKEDQELIKQKYTNFFKNEKEDNVNYSFSLKTGKNIFFNNFSFDLNKQVLWGTILDKTEEEQKKQKYKMIENKAKAFFDASENLCFEIDHKFNLLEVNQKFIDNCYTNKEQLLGKKCYDVLYHRNNICENCPAQKTFDKMKKFKSEKESHDGKIYDITTIPVISNKKVLSVLGNIRDITKYCNHLDYIKKKEMQLRETQSMARVSHWSLEWPNGALELSSEIFSLLDIDVADISALLNKNLSVIFKEDRENLLKECQNVYAQKKEYASFEFRLNTITGNAVFVKVESFLKFNKNGELKYISGYIQDISELKQRELALKISQQRYKAIFDNSDILFGQLNHQGIIIDVNNAFLKKMNVSKDKVLNINIFDFFDKKESDKLKLALKTCEKNNTIQNVEISFTVANHQKHTVMYSCYKLPNKSGTNENDFLLSGFDITTRKLTEEIWKQNSIRNNLLVNSLNLRFAILDLDFNILLVNEIFYKYLSFSADYSQKAIEEIKKCNELDFSKIKTVLLEKEKLTIKYQEKDSNGNLHFFKTSLSLYLVKEDKYILAAIQEIENEANLTEENENLRFLLSQVCNFAVEIDIENKITKIYSLKKNQPWLMNFDTALNRKLSEILVSNFWSNLKIELEKSNIKQLATATKNLTINYDHKNIAVKLCAKKDNRYDLIIFN